MPGVAAGQRFPLSARQNENGSHGLKKGVAQYGSFVA
jgi:hypothetical protein